MLVHLGQGAAEKGGGTELRSFVKASRGLPGHAFRGGCQGAYIPHMGFPPSGRRHSERRVAVGMGDPGR